MIRYSQPVNKNAKTLKDDNEEVEAVEAVENENEDE